MKTLPNMIYSCIIAFACLYVMLHVTPSRAFMNENDILDPGWMFGDPFTQPYFTVTPVRDTGEKGPVYSADKMYEYRGEPRLCQNLMNGAVEPGTYNGVHKLKVNRWRDISPAPHEVRNYVFDATVYGEFEDDESVSLDNCESQSWDLQGYYSSGITINCAEGTMTATLMTRSGSAFGATLIGILVGLMAL